MCFRYSGGGEGEGRAGGVAQGGGPGPGSAGSFDPVYSPPSRGACYQYAIVTEKTSTTKNVKICGTDRRERNVYTSRSLCPKRPNISQLNCILIARINSSKKRWVQVISMERSRAVTELKD